MMPGVRTVVGVLLVATLTGCQGAPRELVAGTDACDFCRMTVSDVRFGAQLQSRTGRIHPFDAIECLASFYLDAEDRHDVRGAWVADYATTRMVPADSALFLRGSRARSPMGRSLVAFAPGTPDHELVSQYGGTIMRWPEVVAFMKAERLVPGAEAPPRPDSGPSQRPEATTRGMFE